MLKIIDVDWVEDKKLELEFSDGFKGIVDLTDTFKAKVFANVEFSEFALMKGCLDWGDVELSANKLREMADSHGEYVEKRALSPDDIEGCLKQAAWDSIELNRPDILQAAIRGYVEEFGIENVQERTQLKSRTSIYKSLKKGTSPKLDTLIQLAHGVVDIVIESGKNKKKQAA